MINYEYDSNLFLSAWRGFREINFNKNSILKNKASNGFVNLYIHNISADYAPGISEQDHIAIQFFKNNDTFIRDSILKRLFADFTKAARFYRDSLPSINSISDYQRLIGLASLSISDESEENFPLVTFKFLCTWNTNCQIKVRLLKNKIIDIQYT